MDRNQFFIPAYEEVISVKVRTTDLRSHWDFSLLGEDNAIDVLIKDVVFASLLEPGSYLQVGDALHLANIGRMQAGIPGDDDISFDVLTHRLERKVVHYAAIKLSLFEDVPFVDYLNN